MQKLKNTENLAPGKVWPVFSLVRYLDKVAEAMVFMFSNTLTCDNAASVQAVKFMHNVSMCSITLEGDMYEPSGTISGGVVPSESGVLVLTQELHAMEEQVNTMRRMLKVLEHKEIKGLGAVGAAVLLQATYNISFLVSTISSYHSHSNAASTASHSRS